MRLGICDKGVEVKEGRAKTRPGWTVMVLLLQGECQRHSLFSFLMYLPA